MANLPFGTAMLSGVVFGPEIVWTWRSLAPFPTFSFAIGQIMKSVVGVLVLRDDFQ